MKDTLTFQHARNKVKYSSLRIAMLVSSILPLCATAFMHSVWSKERVLRQHHAGDVTTADGRRLLADTSNVTQCVWRRNACDLDMDYLTSLSGAPTTDSQKLLARTSALAKTCAGFSTSVECTANASNYCKWSLGSCSLGSGYLNTEWILNRLTCPGSPSAQVLTCIRLTSQSACQGNSNCRWAPSSVDNATLAFTEVVSSWAGESTTSQCMPRWDANTTTVMFAKIVANSVFGAGAAMGVLIGTCTAGTAVTNLLNSCTNETTTGRNRTTCLSMPGCAWTPSGSSSSAAGCEEADDFATALLLNQSDPWVSAVNTARKQCLPLNQTACVASAFITINATRYAEFALAKPTFDSSGGAAATLQPARSILLSALLSLLVALCAKLA